MKVLEVIPCRFYRNKINGRTASVYGAHPAASPAQYEEWEIVTEGWTWENDNGTYGLGRKPAKTREEAEEVMRKFNAREWAK